MMPPAPPPGALSRPWLGDRPRAGEISPVLKTVSVENPLFGGRAQFLHSSFVARLGVNPDHRLGSRQAVAHPGTVVEHQLQSIGAHHFTNLAAREFPRIRSQLLSELLLHLRRQAEVLSPWII